MSNEPNLKQALIEEIEKLPDPQLQVVWNFVQHLPSQLINESEQEQQSGEQTQFPFPPGDPLSEFIGAVSHGTLAQAPDNELYEH